MNNFHIVLAFIEQVWNTGDHDVLKEFIHPYYKDHSLPSTP